MHYRHYLSTKCLPLPDQEEYIKCIILDYQAFKKIEGILIDYGLGKAMEEISDD